MKKGMWKWLRGSTRGWALALGVLLGGLSAEAQQQTVRAEQTTTPLVTGATADRVVASLVDVGVRTGGSVYVVLRLVDASGATVAETSGTVSEGMPLRLSYRATSAAGLSARVIIPLGQGQLTFPLLMIERWTPGTPPVVQPPGLCRPRMGEKDPPPGPVLNVDCNTEYFNFTY
ncbi:hypothetical protein ACLESO_54290 [Pyxidicoccus sp. 3LG]